MQKKKAELRVGMAVRSKCGRDRKRVFLVIDIDTSDPISPVVIADGVLRRIEDRKHKNPAHIMPVSSDYCCSENDVKALVLMGENGKIAEICENAEKRWKNEK